MVRSMPGRRILTTTSLPSCSCAPVDLRDRGRRQRFGVEAREHRLGLAAQVLAQLQQHLQRQRGHVAVQLLELGDVLGKKRVGAARQDLAELDEGRPQLFEHQPQLHRRLQLREVGRVLPAQGVASALQPLGQAKAAHTVAEAVADEHAQNLVEAAHVAGRTQGFNQHPAIIGRARSRTPFCIGAAVHWRSSSAK